MRDVETVLVGARPEWPEPPDSLEAGILAAVGAPAPAVARRFGPAGWVGRGLRSRRGRLLVVGAVLVGSGAALAVALVSRGGGGVEGAPASLAFGAPEVVGDLPGFDTAVDAAVDGSGRVAVVWTRAGRVVVSFRAVGGGWSAPERLSDPARRAAYPRVGAGTDGGFTVVWRERLAGREVVQDFRLPDGSPAGTLEASVGTRWRIAGRTSDERGGWGETEQVSAPTATLRAVYEPQLFTSAAGAATAVFAQGEEVWSARRNADGTWVARRVAGSPGQVADVELAGDRASGAMVATWQSRVTDPAAGSRRQAWIAIGDASGGWSPPRALGVPSSGQPMQTAAVGPDGTVVAAWDADGYVTSVRSPSGDWSGPESVLPGPLALVNDPPAVGVDGDGRAAVAGDLYRVRRFTGGFSMTLEGSRLVVGDVDGWQAPRTIGGPRVGRPVIRGDAAGRLVVLAALTRTARVMVRPVRADGALGPPRSASAGYFRRFVIGEDGTSVVVGTRSTAAGERLQILAAVAPGRGRP
ncbi:MAG: hypothetical protein AB7V62_02220 [Thermoleophilia bacterium]